MTMKVIDAPLLQKAFLAGAKGLEAKKEWINELNVFPVPDGDTGTNMTMTIMAAAKEVAAIEEPTMENLARAISSGSLRGARGNSGVILSQLFRGFTREIRSSETVDVTLLANALVHATETAYKAVMKPKEGTILTVAKGMADKAVELAPHTEDMAEFIRQIIEHGDYVLSQTPEMLPVLKQAGVVDSGGQGLMQVLKGAFDGLTDKEVDLSIPDAIGMGSVAMAPGSAPGAGYGGAAGSADIETADIRYGYCTEFIINLEKPFDEKKEQKFKGYLESIGDSIVVVADEDVVKVHVHTNDPGLAIQKALTYGSLSRMKIDNMREEHNERLIRNAPGTPATREPGQDGAQGTPDKPYGFIAVSVGEGLNRIFSGIGADYLIEGGQTMNPSTEDMVNAINHVHADTVYILPNNKNIILAAEQAKYLVKDKKIIVVPSRTVPQGIAALINFLPSLSAEENLDIMVREMEHVKTGQVTYAVRNTVIDGREIHEGDIMGLGDQGILAVGQSIEDTAVDTAKAMVDPDSELVTVYYGGDVGAEDAQTVLDKIKKACPHVEVELQNGGQPIYYYVISVE